MINSYVISIAEIDDPSEARAELLEKMKDVKLLKNSFGIANAYLDAATSGVYEEISKSLNFPVAGMTTCAQSANGAIDAYAFSITILTSDDCFFSCGRVNVNEENAVNAVKDRFNELEAELKKETSETPKLALLFAPLSSTRSPEEYIDALGEVAPEVPVFGAVATGKLENALDESACLTLLNGKALSDSVVVVLISGDFTPKFFINSVTDEAVLFPNIGKISKCSGNVLYEIDGVGAVKFFNKIGYDIGDSTNTGLMSFLMVMNYDKRSSRPAVTRVPYMVDGDAVISAGYMKDGANLSVAISSPEVVARTAESISAKIKSADGYKNALIYSCVGRRAGLLNEPMKELETIKNALAESGVNYSVGYANGEICPVMSSEKNSERKLENYHHNHTIVACLF